MKYAELERDRSASDLVKAVITFEYVPTRYKIDIIPKKATGTQRNNLMEMAKLLEFFNDPPGPLDAIQPQHVRQ